MSALLAIDTAAPRLHLAVLVEGRLDLSIDEIGQGHAELLFGRLQTLLERNGLHYRDLSRVAATAGPGSFTGLRIGLSAARGLGLALRIPVLGIPSLLALSLSAPQGKPVGVLLDARRGEAYCQSFRAPGEPLGPARLLPLEEARQSLDPNAHLIETPFVDIGALALFTQNLDPEDFPPEAAYIRSADAKPQDKARIPRR